MESGTISRRFKVGISTSDLRCVFVYVATFHQSLQRNMPDDSSLHGHRCESHKLQITNASDLIADINNAHTKISNFVKLIMNITLLIAA